MYSRIFCSRIWDEKKVLHSLISRLMSNYFCIANLTLFFMVRTNKNLCKLKVMVANNPRIHTSLGLTFLGWQKVVLRIVKWVINLAPSSSCNQYWRRTTPNASIKSWFGNWHWKFVISWLASFVHCRFTDVATFSYMSCHKTKCPNLIYICGPNMIPNKLKS